MTVLSFGFFTKPHYPNRVNHHSEGNVNMMYKRKSFSVNSKVGKSRKGVRCLKVFLTSSLHLELGYILHIKLSVNVQSLSPEVMKYLGLVRVNLLL